MKFRAALFLAGLGSFIAQAAITDDWQRCVNGILAQPGAQNRTDAPSEYCVGLAYMQGFYGRKDLALAAQYWKKAADQNYTLAIVTLAYSYQRGYGVPQNLATAVDLYRKAAAAGSGEAMLMLAKLYDAGEGVPKNPAEAAKYYQAAANAGVEEAKRHIAAAREPATAGDNLIEQGNQARAAKNYAGAIAAYRKASEMGNPYGDANLGLMYEGGFGVQKSDQTALQYYLKAAARNVAAAQFHAGMCYEMGRGTAENWAEAVKWYEKSAAQANPEGQFALGRMYQFGMSVPMNRATAISWFRKAASQGNSQAAYFANWLSDANNGAGFRNDEEKNLVVANKMRVVLGAMDPAGISFRNSAERMKWLAGTRQKLDKIDAETAWIARKGEYDSCMANHGGNCLPPGPRPK